MICPRCKRYHNVLEYVPMMTVEEYAADTTPVYRCPVCRWIFAPADPVTVVAGPFVAPEVMTAA